MADTSDEEETQAVNTMKRALSDMSDPGNSAVRRETLEKTGSSPKKEAFSLSSPVKTVSSITKDAYQHSHPEHKILLTKDEMWLTDELFMKIDLDKNGTIEVDELSILHGFDREVIHNPYITNSKPNPTLNITSTRS